MELLSCVSITFDRNGIPVYAYYLPTEVRSEAEVNYKANVNIFDKIKNPVLIDTYTGEVYDEIVEKENDQGLTYYNDLPIKDYPLMLADKSAFELELEWSLIRKSLFQ